MKRQVNARVVDIIGLPWRMLAFSQGMAVLWWLIALFISHLHILPIWIDQQIHLTYAASQFLTPYQLPGYVYPPWAVVFLIPFNGMTLPLSTLIQTGLLFGLLTLVLRKYGGGWRAVLMTFYLVYRAGCGYGTQH